MEYIYIILHYIYIILYSIYRISYIIYHILYIRVREKTRKGGREARKRKFKENIPSKYKHEPPDTTSHAKSQNVDVNFYIPSTRETEAGDWGRWQ